MTITQKYDSLSAKLGLANAIARARAHYASMALGRNWQESAEDYLARRPDMSELLGWIKTHSETR